MRTLYIEFYISSKAICIDAISKTLADIPSKIVTSFPKNSIADPYWKTSVTGTWNNIEQPINILCNKIEHHLDFINKLRKNGAETTLVIRILTDYADRPEISFSSCLLNRLASIADEVNMSVDYEW